MIEQPRIIETADQHTAIIHLTIPAKDCPQHMRASITELMETIAAQGIQAAGALFSHHLRMPSDMFDFEVGIPVATPVAAAGRVQPGKLRGGKLARTTYQGPYEGLGQAWGEFSQWIAANGHQPGPDLWESYVAGPETGRDASQYRTEFSRPLAS
jgi:effector-binding domain-containing protein